MFECPRWARGPHLLATKEINRIGHSCHSQGRLIVCFLAKALISQYLALTSATLTNPSHDASVPLTAPWVPPSWARWVEISEFPLLYFRVVPGQDVLNSKILSRVRWLHCQARLVVARWSPFGVPPAAQTSSLVAVGFHPARRSSCSCR